MNNLKIIQAARELQVSRNTIKKEINEGRLGAVKIGGQILIPQENFKKYIEASKVRVSKKPTERRETPSGEKLG